MELNGYRNIEVHNLAAWDKAEDNFIRRDMAINEKAEHPSKIQVNAGYTQGIKGIVLDDVLPEKVDFIKIDTDGSEPKVLKGLIKTFERNPQLKLIIEYYPECVRRLGNNPDEIMAILNRYFICKKIEGEYTNEYYNLLCLPKC